MTLKDKFIFDFKNQPIITTKEIFEWYKNAKRSESEHTHTYHSTIYSIIINPLLNENRIKKVSKGVYKLNSVYIDRTVQPIKDYEMNDDELDEFDLYIKNKIKRGI